MLQVPLDPWVHCLQQILKSAMVKPRARMKGQNYSAQECIKAEIEDMYVPADANQSINQSIMVLVKASPLAQAIPTYDA